MRRRGQRLEPFTNRFDVPGGSTATIDSAQEIEDDGSDVPRHAFVEVIAVKDQVSAVVGVSLALAVLELSGGEFYGTGLDTSYERQQLSELLTLFPPADETAPSVAARITKAATVVGHGEGPIQWDRPDL